MDALLERLEQGGDGPPAVAEVAGRAGLRTWVVLRACRAAKFPASERVIEWVTLIYVIAVAQAERLSIARAAARVGVSGKYIRSLRASLLPETPRLTGALATDVLAHAIARFAEACGVPREQATAAAERLIASNSPTSTRQDQTRGGEYFTGC